MSLSKIDRLINLVGEMVIAQSRLERISDDLDHAAFADLHTTVRQLQHNMRDMPDRDVWRLIFAPDFSPATTISRASAAGSNGSHSAER